MASSLPQTQMATYRNSDVCIYIDFLVLLAERTQKPGAHPAPKSWFLPTSNKRSWDSLGKRLILDLEQEIYKMIPEHLVVAEK